MGKLGLAGVVVLGAVLRFAELGTRSFWRDEAVSVLLTRMRFGDMLATIPETEGTPPLFYVLAWGWTRIFGDAEAGLRSLPALAGTVTIPVAYAIATRLAGRRAGLATALLTAVSPLLVWHSQDARAYALLVLLGALSFLACLAAREALLEDAELGAAGRGKAVTSPLALWAVASALAVATHYFALFLVVAEALWLLFAGAPVRRPAASRSSSPS